MHTINICIRQTETGIEISTTLPKPMIGMGLTAVESTALSCVNAAMHSGCVVNYDDRTSPLIRLAYDLLHPEEMGYAVTHEVRQRARTALGRVLA